MHAAPTEKGGEHAGIVSELNRDAPPRLRQYPAHPAQAFGAGRAAAPAHHPASVVGHGDQAERKGVKSPVQRPGDTPEHADPLHSRSVNARVLHFCSGHQSDT